MLVTSNFSFSQNFFYPFWRTFRHFHQTSNCRLQTLSVRKSLKFVVWERVNTPDRIFHGRTGGGVSIFIFMDLINLDRNVDLQQCQDK